MKRRLSTDAFSPQYGAASASHSPQFQFYATFRLPTRQTASIEKSLPTLSNFFFPRPGYVILMVVRFGKDSSYAN
jgi:hypothetical protein